MKKVRSLSLATFFAVGLIVLSGFVNNNKSDPDPEQYFKVFLGKSGNDLRDEFLKLQPRLDDCKAIFKDEYYKEMYEDINKSYTKFSKEFETIDYGFEKMKVCRAFAFNTNDMIRNRCEICPGKMENMQLGKKFKPNILCYKLQFVETEANQSGMSIVYFAFLNGHWVYFPTN